MSDHHRVSRRQALAGAGSVTIAALLAACGGDDKGGTTATGTADVPTADGTTATVQPSSASSGQAAALLDDTSACALTPEQTEGPYYFDADRIRSDVREGRPGTELQLAIRVRDAECKALKDAVVEIWHADAGGAYSGFDQAATQTTYMRGAQVTDADGVVTFVTVYPGWYQGRTVHIHAKVHLAKTSLLTTQIYFDDALSDRVFARAPYSARGERDVRNDGDGIFSAQTLAKVGEDGDTVLAAISFDVGDA
jgi:protocatechuate 3,4-dioxygenase beta subunit